MAGSTNNFLKKDQAMQWFSYDSDEGFVIHATESEAKRHAKSSLEWWRNKAMSEGGDWDGDVPESICWGVVTGRVIKTNVHELGFDLLLVDANE